MAPENEAGAEAPEAEAANEQGETKELENAEENPSIESIQALSDDEIHTLLGHKKDLENVRKGLTETAKLTGKAREYAEKRIQDWFTPHVYAGDFKYLAEDAVRATAKKTAKDALNDTSPCSVL
jgi:hypothetical protein